MSGLYRICSVIYCLGLLVVIPAELFGNLAAGVAGHNKPFGLDDWLLFAFLFLTPATVTSRIYIDSGKRIRRTIDYISILLVTVSVVLILYGLFEGVSDSGSSADEMVVLSVMAVFLLISLVVLWGLIRGLRGRGG